MFTQGDRRPYVRSADRFRIVDRNQGGRRRHSAPSPSGGPKDYEGPDRNIKEIIKGVL